MLRIPEIIKGFVHALVNERLENVYNLSNIKVTKDYFYATDGHVAFRSKNTMEVEPSSHLGNAFEEIEYPVYIPKSAFSKAIKKYRTRRDSMGIFLGVNKLVTKDKGVIETTSYEPKKEYGYPDVDKLFEEYKGKEAVDINIGVAALKTLLEVSKKAEYINIKVIDGESPMIVNIVDYCTGKIDGIIMPVRAQDDL